MSEPVRFEIEFPNGLDRLRFPEALDDRLQLLLDKNGGSGTLTTAERAEVEGLVEVAELLTLLRGRAERLAREATVGS